MTKRLDPEVKAARAAARKEARAALRITHREWWDDAHDAGIVINISFTDEPVKASAIIRPYQPLTNCESVKLLSSESQEIWK